MSPLRLPAFHVGAAPVAADRLVDVGRAIFAADVFSVGEDASGLHARAGWLSVEADAAAGALWAADQRQLWNPALSPKLISPRRARVLARDLVGELALEPAGDGQLPLVALEPGATLVAARAGGDRVDRQLDVQARFATEVPLGPDRPALPVVGGGGRVGVVFGHEGRVVGLRASTRPVLERFDVEVIDRAEADERFRALTDGLEVCDVEATLAYYAAPAGVRQDVMAPVYLYRGRITVGRRTVPMRLVTVAATDFGPHAPLLPAQAPRRAAPGRLPLATAGRRRPATAARHPFEAGASWIGPSGGLGGSPANAQGFVDALAADGWRIDFNWGDANAWASDWHRNDDTWVDAADFVFYTGHADGDGWLLAAPDDGSLHYCEIGPAPAAGRNGDRFGRRDLEWMVVAACGPLEDDIVAPGGGDVLERWDGAFDGLHQLLGYGAVTYDNTEEGGRIVGHARRGATVASAWLRTAQEIQSSTNGLSPPFGPDVWVGVLWAARPDADPIDDHLWGHGPVAADPTDPTVLSCMWTTC